MVMKFTNNATSTLASGITSIATSLTVATGQGALFPTTGAGDYFYCTLANISGAIEIVKVTARSTDTFTVTRGQDGTTGLVWNTGDKVELRLVAASLNDLPKLDEANTFALAQTFTTALAVTSGGTGVTTSTGSGANVLGTNPTITNYVESVVAIGNSGTTQTIALTSGTVQTVTMTGNCTFTMPTATAGKSFILIATQDATGSRTGVFTSVKWAGGTAPTLTTTASTGRDILTFVADGTNWYGTYAQAFA